MAWMAHTFTAVPGPVDPTICTENLMLKAVPSTSYEAGVENTAVPGAPTGMLGWMGSLVFCVPELVT
jgi:hypothetical protein